MQIWLQWAVLAFWLGMQIRTWTLWEELAFDLREEWELDYRQLSCGHLAALEKNLEVGQAFLALRHPLPDYQRRLQIAEEELLSGWLDAFDGICGPDSGEYFELYLQDNPDLAPDYPNWWVHWSLPYE